MAFLRAESMASSARRRVSAEACVGPCVLRGCAVGRTVGGCVFEDVEAGISWEEVSA